MKRLFETSTIEKIDLKIKELDSLGEISIESNKLLQKKIRLEFNYNSNHIEGNTLTYGQTELLLLHDRSVGNAKVSDLEEMKAHDLALKDILELSKDVERPLTESYIKELNKIILVQPFYKDAVAPDGSSTRKKIEIGQYKSMPNSVRLKNGEVHEYASPEETPAKMRDLMEWYNSNYGKVHPVQLASEFHYKFVCIHPFDDGNGRVSRLVMNYILMKNNFPPVIIKSEDKDNYLTALQKADAGDVQSIVEYVEEQLLWSIDLYIKAKRGHDIEEDDDLDKEIAILKKNKSSKFKVFKTPRLLYDVINNIQQDLVNDIGSSIFKFESFFVDIEKYTVIDGVLHKPSKLKQNRSSFFEAVAKMTPYIKEDINKYEIFGHDLVENDINEIIWKYSLLSLKSSKEKTDFQLNIKLSMYDDSYSLEIVFVDKKEEVLLDLSNNYNISLLKDEINSINKIIVKYIIKRINSY
jgi:Fic family protein